jgi:NADPH2:quinone reductase
MKAIQVSRFGPPEVLELSEVEDPACADDECIVKIHAIGVNPVDTYIRSGTYGERPLPYIPGSDAAGVVSAVGHLVHRWKVGDRVYLAGSLSGTYAEQARCHPEQLHPLPDSVSFAQGAALYVPYSTAYRALFQRGQAVTGEWVLIHGASGGVGLAAVQWARARIAGNRHGRHRGRSGSGPRSGGRFRREPPRSPGKNRCHN